MKVYSKLPYSRRIIAGIISVFLAMESGVVVALGLGNLTHESYIGQRFSGTIELVGDDRVAPENIIVKQLSEARAAELGMEMLPFPYQLNFEPQIRNGRVTALDVTSSQNIYEPYISVVVELIWPGGAVFREYALLMDTPPQQPVSTNERAAQTAAGALNQAPSTPNSVRNTVRSTQNIELGTSYVVQPGDTLTGIVARIERPDTVTLGEMVQVVFQANPSAFLNGDINYLKAGAPLAVPSNPAPRSQFSSANPADTRGESAAPSGTPGGSLTSDNVISAEREGRLSLSDGGKPDKGADYDVPQIQEQIDGTQEMIDMLVRENQDLRDRIDQIENSDYLTTLSELVAMQRLQIEELREEFRAQTGAETNDASSFDQEGTSVAAPIPATRSTSPGNNELSLSQKLAQNFWSFISLVVLAFVALIALCVYAVRKFTDSRREEAEYTQYRESIESSVDFVGIKETADIEATPSSPSNVTTIESAINSRRRTPLRDRISDTQRDKKARDAEVKERIRQKTDEYNASPVASQSDSERHKVGVNVVMGLDEEVNELLSMAKIYCSAGKYSEARAILNAQNREGSDPRLIDALEQIDLLERQSGEEKA